MIEDHFDRQFELEHTLETRGKKDALDREDIADTFMAELKTMTGELPISIEE